MRVSALKGDEGYTKFQYHFLFKGMDVKVLLDGVEQKECLTADDTLGYVLKASLPIRDQGGAIATEELYGKVEIIGVPLKGTK